MKNTINKKNLTKIQQYIYYQENHWYKHFRKFLSGKILKIGSGLGFMTTFIRNDNPHLTVLEVEKNPKDINCDIVNLYDGMKIPYTNKLFDVVVCTYVLHHTECPIFLLSEMKRVAKRIILLEETYTNLYTKLDLVARDIYVNIKSGQPSSINWGSYFEEDLLKHVIKLSGMNITFHREEPKRSYKKELYVLET